MTIIHVAQTACDLELWQEAFRSVEDIQGLMTLGKKAPKPQLMATYYARLTRIFMVSGSHLYNGYAWCASCFCRPKMLICAWCVSCFCRPKRFICEVIAAPAS